MTLIVTVPHKCIYGADDPGCDENADVFGTRLAHLLKADLLIGDTLRKQCDLNRSVCRNEPMRKKLTNMLLAGSQQHILLDVHTFEHKKFPGLLGSDNDAWFVVMGGKYTHIPHTLYKRMVAAGCNVAFSQDDVNDIVDQANILGIPAALLEIRDDLPLKYLNGIAKVIRAWMTDLVAQA